MGKILRNWKILTTPRENIFQNPEVFLDFFIFVFHEKFQTIEMNQKSFQK